MKQSERVLQTLEFEKMHGEASVLETFYPWDETVNRWVEQGVPECYGGKNLYPADQKQGKIQNCMNTLETDLLADYEHYLGFDALRRISFQIPYEKFCRQGDITDWESWNKLKDQLTQELERDCTDENIKALFEPYREGHERGDFSIRIRAGGFFWIPRDLLGIEEHLYAFYDEPELIHDINQFVLDVYLKYLTKVTAVIKPEVLLLPEDLSGKNGSMLSPECFDEFVGAYYKKLFPALRESGVKNIFVDTDGDFRLLIPNFLEAGVDGFLPVDVNAGMDIVEVRKEFPKVKFIGGFNKLVLLDGPEAIDQEFARLLPVILQGGYIPGLDHQAAPATTLENYRYYIGKLREIMALR